MEGGVGHEDTGVCGITLISLPVWGPALVEPAGIKTAKKPVPWNGQFPVFRLARRHATVSDSALREEQ